MSFIGHLHIYPFASYLSAIQFVDRFPSIAFFFHVNERIVFHHIALYHLPVGFERGSEIGGVAVGADVAYEYFPGVLRPGLGQLNYHFLAVDFPAVQLLNRLRSTVRHSHVNESVLLHDGAAHHRAVLLEELAQLLLRGPVIHITDENLHCVPHCSNLEREKQKRK